MPSVVPLLLLGEGINNHWKSLEKKQTERDREFLLLAQTIRLLALMPLICFCDGMKSEMTYINSLSYQQIQTEALKLKTVNAAYDPWVIQLQALPMAGGIKEVKWPWVESQVGCC